MQSVYKASMQLHCTIVIVTLKPAAASHQFHQYYIHGKLSDCKEEKERMFNCVRWRGIGKESAKVSQ